MHRSKSASQSSSQWDNYFVLFFIFLVLMMRVVARRTLAPDMPKLPPKDQLEKFQPVSKNSALASMERNEDGQISLKLKTKIKISNDTYIFRFELPEFDMSLGLPVGNHVNFFATIDGEEVQRPYTPISDVKEQTFVDFVIKIYRKGAHPKFPDGGQMTQYLENLEIG